MASSIVRAENRRYKGHLPLVLFLPILSIAAAEGFSSHDVATKTGMPQRTQANIRKKAYERGFRPEVDPIILEHYVQDGTHTGRPPEISKQVQEKLLINVRKDRAGREKSSEVLAYEVGISASSALRILRKHGLSSDKPTRKPGLNIAQKMSRYSFALAHKDWTLEEWMNVIFSDEASFIPGQRRGAVRLWRDSGEAYDMTRIRHRWNGFSEFMFWGCFGWDLKAPYHIWTKETAQERKQADKELEQLNADLEPWLKAEWAVDNGMRRLNLRRNPKGRKPQWRFTKADGTLVREGKSGG